jgi:hypothetical protein
MKLGATISSERGKPVTKTGNDYLEIVVKGEDGTLIARLTIKPAYHNKSELHYYDNTMQSDGFTSNPSIKKNGNLKHDKCTCIPDSTKMCPYCYENVPF